MARDKLKTFTLYKTVQVSKEAIVTTGSDGIEFTAEYTAELFWERVNSACHMRFGNVLPHDLTSPARRNPSGLLTNNEAYPRDDCANVTAPSATDAVELANLIKFCEAELPGTKDCATLIFVWVGKIENNIRFLKRKALKDRVRPGAAARGDTVVTGHDDDGDEDEDREDDLPAVPDNSSLIASIVPHRMPPSA
jgi:hypothetical protein